ncbi:hypothetical protein ACM66B_006910 [Microbotryomycetes sp. NB124-2]
MRRAWTALAAAALLAIVCVTTACAHSSDTHQHVNEPQLVPLFTPRHSNTSSSSVRRLHTSLATLLPILPLLAPPPSHTLLVTLATPAFKPLLFNWLCFLRHKAHWGRQHDNNAEHELQKVLIVTSDQGLARELSEDARGLVVWWLKGVDPHDLEAHVDSLKTRSTRAQDQNSDETTTTTDALLELDLFKTLRTLDLLLPPDPPDEASAQGTTQSMLEWGSLHYQSLMLERTLVMSTLVGALTESQAVDRSDRLEAERDRWDTLERGQEPAKEVEGVRGVLLVDNDAVWLADPSPMLDNAYVPGSLHPSFLWSPDTSPDTPNSYGTYSMPCACFIYSRTSDEDSSLASLVDSKRDVDRRDGQEYRPSRGAALAWRWTAMCHIAMVMNSFEHAQSSAAYALSGQMDDQEEEDENEQVVDQEVLSNLGSLETVDNATAVESGTSKPTSTGPRRIKSLVRANAPSFQATSLGPALFLAEQGFENLGNVEHQEWIDSISSGDPRQLLGILDRAGLGLPAQKDQRELEEQERLADERRRWILEDDDDDGYDDGEFEDTPFEDESPEEFFERIGRDKGREWLKTHATSDDPTRRLTCDKLAQRLSRTSPRLSSPNAAAQDQDELTSLTREYFARKDNSKPNPMRIKTQSLPYDLFPPGMRYFGSPDDFRRGIGKGTRVCVVHANYATGMDKENLLRKAGLWALVNTGNDEFMCDAQVMARA